MADVNTFYRAKRAQPSGNVVAETTIKTADDVTKPILVYAKASGALDGQGLKLVVRGNVVFGTSGALTVVIRQGTTVAGVLVATSGAVTPGAGNFNFELVAELVWDSVSKRIRGLMKGHLGDAAIAQAVNSNPVTAVDPAAADNLPFCATALFGASHASNDLKVTEFLAETN